MSTYQTRDSSYHLQVCPWKLTLNKRIHYNVMNHSLFQDVHMYDYAYATQKHETLLMSILDKETWIKALMTRMKNPIAIQGAHMILANMGREANYDSTNTKYAEDILVFLSIHMQKDTDLLPLIEEQLQDMVQLGQCAQGRTTRLWQLYLTIPKNEK